MSKSHTIIAILEAKKGKEQELKQALIEVIAPSRNESTCLEFRLHQAKNNPQQFVIYENWQSQEEHAKQFEKPYIINFVKKTEALLAKPFEVIYAEEIR